MKRSIDNRTETGRLPSFLDEADRGADAITAERTVDEPGDDGFAAAEAVVDDPQAESPDAAAADDEPDFEPGDLGDDESTAATATPQRVRRGLAWKPTTTGGAAGGPLTFAGVLLLLVATAACFAPALGAWLRSAGVAPDGLLAVGAVVAAIGVVQRRTSQLRQHFDASLTERQDADDELREALAELVGAHRAGHAVSGEPGDLQHVLLSLQRQDQKINNLTRAIKMYGKPLMEIAAQGTELAGGVAQVKTLVEGGAETTRVAVNRLENELRSRSAKTDLGQLPQQIGRIEVALAALAQRIESSELHKSLVRLEDASAKAHAELQQLLRGDNVKKAADDLQQRLDKAAQGLADGIRQLRDGNIGTLENAVREIQREVAGLATGVAQIQAAVRSGSRAVATSAAATKEPAAEAPAATPATAAAPAAAGRHDAPATGGNDADAGGYQTGKRTSAGKNVLGAIAKLKQMKG